MERKMIVIFCVVGFLGLLSAALGFAAEAIRTRGTHVEYPSSVCAYALTSAQILATASFGSLFLAMTIFEGATANLHRGILPTHQQNSKRTLARICCISYTLTYVIAICLLLTGVFRNIHRSRPGCYVVKPGIFAGGAVFSLASVLLILITYLISTSTKSEINPTGLPSSPSQGGIAMGQPQIPPV